MHDPPRVADRRRAKRTRISSLVTFALRRVAAKRRFAPFRRLPRGANSLSFLKYGKVARRLLYGFPQRGRAGGARSRRSPPLNARAPTRSGVGAFVHLINREGTVMRKIVSSLLFVVAVVGLFLAQIDIASSFGFRRFNPDGFHNSPSPSPSPSPTPTNG